MTEAVKVAIGDKEYEFKELVYRQIKKIWPIVKAKMEGAEGETDMDKLFGASDGAVEIVSIALIKYHPELTADFIEENLKATQLAALPQAVVKLLKISGMTPGEFGPLVGDKAAPPSTATGTS